MYNSYSGLGEPASKADVAAQALRSLSGEYASAKNPEERSDAVDFFLEARLTPVKSYLATVGNSSVAALDSKLKLIEVSKKVGRASTNDSAIFPKLKTVVTTYMTLSGLASQYMLLTTDQAKDIYKKKSIKEAFEVIKKLLKDQKTIVPKDVEDALVKFGKAVDTAKSSEEINNAFNALLAETACQLDKSEWSKTLSDFADAAPNETDLKIQMLLIALKGFATKSDAMSNKEYLAIAEKEDTKLKALYEALKNAIIKKKQGSSAASSEEGLSTGAIVGIIAGVGILAGGAWWYSQQSKKG